MYLHRFLLLLRYFHIADNKKDDKSDLLYKIRYLIESMNSKFSEYYDSNKNLSIDECMIKFNGRLKFKQYIMNKPVKFGVKGFLLCDSSNYYCHRIEIYSGKSKEKLKNKDKFHETEKIILKLTKDFLNQ